MAVDISLRDVPEALAERLRHLADAHNRTLEAEVVEILQASVKAKRLLSFTDFAAEARAEGRSTPAEAAAMMREDRDGGHRD